MGKPPAVPEIAGFKLLASSAAMDFLEKIDKKEFVAMEHFP
jgi:hypothetical protein